MAALKAAIASANANGEDDTINLAPNGSYTLDIGEQLHQRSQRSAGDRRRQRPQASRLPVTDATISVIRSFFTPISAILQIGPGADVTLDDLTIAKGIGY